MATKLPRLSVTFPAELFAMLQRDANLFERSISSQIIWSLKRYYQDRKTEADLFTPTPLREGKRPEVPVFDTQPPLDAERSSKIRARLESDRT